MRHEKSDDLLALSLDFYNKLYLTCLFFFLTDSPTFEEETKIIHVLLENISTHTLQCVKTVERTTGQSKIMIITVTVTEYNDIQ